MKSEKKHAMLLAVSVAMLVMSILCKATATQTGKSNQSEIRTLKIGEMIEKQLSGGQSHSYEIKLDAGQFAEATVTQLSIDVVAVLSGTDGKSIVEMDSPNGSQGPETVVLVAKIPGAYRLTVRSLDPGAVAGKYQVRLDEIRSATAQDESRVEAQDLFVAGRDLMVQGTTDSLNKGIEKLKAALPLWRVANDRQREAYTLSFIGSSYDRLEEYQKALDCYLPLLEITRAIGDRVLETGTLGNIGGEYYSLGEPQKALDYYQQALLLGQTAQNEMNQSPLLNNIALLYDSLGDGRQALHYYNLALPLIHASGDRRVEAVALNNIGQTYAAFGENREAFDYLQQSLVLRRATGDHQGEGTTISNIGVLYEATGDFEKALECYKQALEIGRKAGQRRTEAIALNNLGGIYNLLNEGQTALEYLNEALVLWQAINEKSGAARALNNIGLARLSLNDERGALEDFNRALILMRECGDRRGESKTLGNVGNILDSLGEKQKAVEYFSQALALERATEDRRAEALTLNYLATTSVSMSKPEQALDYFEQSLRLSQAVEDRNLEAAALKGIAGVERDRGRVTEARERIESALSRIESIHAVMVSTELRTSYFASAQRYYEFEIDLLMQMHRSQPNRGYAVAALEVSERARARDLLELLGEARVDIRQGVDPALLEREHLLQERLNAKAESQTQMLNRKHTDEQVAVFRKEIDELLAQYRDVEAQIRISSPRYAALTQPGPLTSREIQQLLDPDTVLLEYALGEEHSYLWLVTPNSIDGFSLPARATIESAARRVYELLNERNRRVKFESARGRTLRLARADADYEETSAKLSEAILGPAIERLGNKRLLIVSDGVLDYIPFAALPIPRSTLPMVMRHEVVNLPSASALAALRHDVTGRAKATKALAVIADPVFETDDPRVRRVTISSDNSKAPISSSRDELLRASRDVEPDEVGHIARLPFTRREAIGISSLVPASQRWRALDFEANRATAMSPQLANYRFIHFATHGFLNTKHPELSGIVLSLVDEHGEDQKGFLRANEIFNLKLPAELVVLSGCRTGLGKEKKGEGLLGLTRGFMYAGAARVLVSLWSVSDEASAELMTRAYKGMLGKQRLRPSAALRAAQISVAKTKRWSAPYYWAAFVLQGEPR